VATTPGTFKHRHQTLLPDAGADVDAPEWNDSHVVAGGSDGQVATKDSTQPDGWGWGTAAPLASPAFTGTPTAPTATPGTISTTQIATTAFVQAALGSGQIPFPATQNPSSNPNVLDDYEEGVFTPTITSDGGASGQTYSAQVGTYTKMGRSVVARFQVVLSAKGTLNGFIQIAGFPMFGGTAFNSWPVDVLWYSLATGYVKIVFEISGSSGAGYLRPIASANTDLINATMTTAALNNTSAFLGVAVYAVG